MAQRKLDDSTVTTMNAVFPIIEFIRDVVSSSNTKGVVIGISGGIDSALVAYLCSVALPSNDVHALMLPYRDQSTDDAELVVRELNLKNVRTINIYKGVKAIADSVSKKQDKLFLGNIMARVRMATLYAYASIHNLLVVGTTNRSEFMMGYFTKYGDGGVDIEPILHLYKTEVWELAKNVCLPQKIIKKPPSADLWPGQTDEKELGITYERLDRILESFFSNAEDALVAKATGTTEKEVGMVRERYLRMAHKREIPPSLRFLRNG